MENILQFNHTDNYDKELMTRGIMYVSKYYKISKDWWEYINNENFENKINTCLNEIVDFINEYYLFSKTFAISINDEKFYLFNIHYNKNNVYIQIGLDFGSIEEVFIEISDNKFKSFSYKVGDKCIKSYNDSLSLTKNGYLKLTEVFIRCLRNNIDYLRED